MMSTIRVLQAADQGRLVLESIVEVLSARFTVANMLRAGTLPGFKDGHLWRIRAADLDAYIVEKSVAAAAKRAAKAKRPEVAP